MQVPKQETHMPDTTHARKERLAAQIRSDILTLRLAPGEDLDETRLSTEFGLSRTPLREVFRELAGEGYLSHKANRGVRVIDLSHMTLRSFFLAAPMIYSAVLQLAAQNATHDQIRDLKAAQDTFRTALRSGSAADRALANNRFHAICGDMARNIYLLPSYHRLLIDHARIGMTFYDPRNAARQDRLNTAADQHDAIIAAIETGDAGAAGQLALDHWELSRSEIESFVMPSGLDAPLGTFPEKRSA